MSTEEKKAVPAASTSTATDADVKIQSLDDSPIVEETVKLVSKDKQSFEVTKRQAFISNLVKTSCEGDREAKEIPLPGVAGNILALVVNYMKHHNGTEPAIIDKPLRSKIMKDVVKNAWDAPFIDDIGEDRQKLYDLILAANYMDIKALLHLGCAKVASLIKGQPLEKIKEILSKGISPATADKEKKESKKMDTSDG